MASNESNQKKINFKEIIRNELRISQNEIRLDSLYQNLLFEKVFDGNPQPLAAMTGWSLAPEFSWWLFNYVSDHKPQNIIEFGSGISTLVISSALKKNEISAKFVSIEHDYKYYIRSKKLISDLDLDDYVEIIYCPLEVVLINNESFNWYGLPYTYINELFIQNGIDLILIDGPPANTNRLARFPALPMLNDYIKDKTSIILDDADRSEEKEILERWADFKDGFSSKMLVDIRHSPALFSIDENSEFPLSKTSLDKEKNLEKKFDENRSDNFYKEKAYKLSLEVDQLKSNLISYNDKVSYLELENIALESELNGLKQSVQLKLGEIVYKLTRRRIGWFKLPIGIRRVLKAHSHFEVKKNWVSTPVISEAVFNEIKKLPRKNIVYAASVVKKNYGSKAAFDFCELNASKFQKPILPIMKANISLDDDNDWLQNVNEYLLQQNLSPVSLNNDNSDRFLRVKSDIRTVVNGPLVTVIMPVFNSQKTLVHAVNSILNQTWQNIELIIVDDCSDDGSIRIAKEFENKDSRVKILSNTVNVGPYVSKNLALRVANGEFITGQDADDWSHPQRIENDIQTILNSKGKVKATLSTMLRMNLQGEFTQLGKVGATSKDGVMRISSISLLIEKETLKNYLGGWDSARFGADSELILRVEKYLGSAFQKVHRVGMFCLDIETSLTNHPELGVCKINGISDVRKEYKASYTQWHESLKDDYKIPFPFFDRTFPIPQEMFVSPEDIEVNIQAHKNQS